MFDLPLIRIPEVVHIGTRPDPAYTGHATRGMSLEGDLLSVSTEPDEWSRIAKLGGGTWWAMRGPGNFVDMHASADQREALLAARPDLVKPCAIWAGSYDDEDYGGTAVQTFWSREAARREEVEDIEKRAGWKPTPRLKARYPDLCQHPSLVADAATFAIIGDAAQAGADIDGLWWDDEIALWSAPRGGIFPLRIPLWRVRRL